MLPRRSAASGASLDVLRDAVARRVAETSLRQTAREIGLSHQALSRFARAETEPYGSTVAKIKAWHSGAANRLERLERENSELRKALEECEAKLRKR